MGRTSCGAEGRIYSGRPVCPIQTPTGNVMYGGGLAGEACLTPAFEKVH
jgi:hypothetical protein